MMRTMRATSLLVGIYSILLCFSYIIIVCLYYYNRIINCKFTIIIICLFVQLFYVIIIGKRIGNSSSSDSNRYTESVYDLLYLTPSKRLEQWCIKEQHSVHDKKHIPAPSTTTTIATTTTATSTRYKKQYYISNSLLALDQKELYPSVYELIRSRKGYKLGTIN